MDNYVGKTEEVAASLIEDDGLKAEVDYEENDQVPDGQVFDQDPPEGTKLERARRSS